MRFRSCFLTVLFFHFLFGQLLLLQSLPFLLEYSAIKCFSHSAFSPPSWLGSDVQANWHRHLLNTEHSLRPSRILACGSEIHGFLLFVEQMGSWSFKPLHFFSLFRDTVYSLLMLGSRSNSPWWVCTAAEFHLYIYIYSLGNMPDVQLTVMLLIQKPLLIELWNCFLDAACWNLWDSLFIGDDYLQRTQLAGK